MKRVLIGSLRHRIVIEAPVRTSDGGGGALVTWTPVAEVWAAITPSTGGESNLAEGVSGRISHEIAIRHRGGIAPAMRMRLGSRTFEIMAALIIDERRRMLRCLCREELL